MFNQWIVKLLDLMPRDLVWIFSKRYIAGKELKDAVNVTRKLNKQRIKATMDLLGEFQTRAEKVQYYKEEYIRLIETSVKNGLDNSFSIKPTMFGLLLNENICYSIIHEIVTKAASLGRFIRIDMEDSQCTDRELDLYKKLLMEFPGHVGIVLQAYLKRTLDDLKDLVVFDKGRGLINVRICKGIYNEPSVLAFKNKDEINTNFLIDLEYMLQNNIYAAIATHDRKLIQGSYALIARHKIDNKKFEFQMLYGVTPELRKSVVDRGHTMRVYVPYGKDWYNYSSRRLRENPRMVSHIIKALFFRG
ncbi:proline dehydrogenase [bacterium]|nr:MAG: proline dehydrogenase [bacterium]